MSLIVSNLHISQRFWAIFNFIGIIYTNKQFFLQYNNRYVKSNIKSNLHNSCWKKPNPYSRCQTCENRACHMTTIFATALGVFVWRKTSISTTTHYRGPTAIPIIPDKYNMPSSFGRMKTNIENAAVREPIMIWMVAKNQKKTHLNQTNLA